MTEFSDDPKTLLDHRGYGHLRSQLTTPEISRIQKALSFKPLVMEGYSFGPPPVIKMYGYSPKRIWLPKNFGISEFGIPEINNERSGDEISARFTGTLKDIQIDVVDDILQKLRTHDSGIICLPTGFGKTVIAIYLACKLRKKTLWVTHKTNLMDQTRDRFNSFTDGTVGRIQQDITDIDHPFVIGMLQSISMKDYPKEIFDSFGLVIFDEVHHVPSNVFSKSLWKINTKHIVGLSATLERKDQLDKILTCCIGPVLKRVEAQQNIPDVKCIKAKYASTEREMHVNKMGKPDIPKLLNDICGDKIRNDLIASTAIQEMNAGRNILILSDRRKHCTDLLDLCLLRDPDCSVGLYLGGLTAKDLQDSNTRKIIIGTYTMCGEGYDNSALNTVILATSKRDIRQAVGRILGLRSQGKLVPLIIDITDTSGVFGSQAAGRKQWYRENGFNILGAKVRPPKKDITSYYIQD